MELKLIKELRKRVPKFRRQEAHRRKRLTKSGWRVPRGAQSKLRKHHKGKGVRVHVGYRIPKVIRGLIKGKEPVHVAAISDLKGLDKTKQIVIINSSVGMKKRLEIVKQAIKLGLEIQNINAQKYEAVVKKKLEARKAGSKARKAKKDKRKKKAEKKKAKKDKTEEKPKEEKAEVKEEPKKEVPKKTPAKKKAPAKKIAAAPIEKKKAPAKKKPVKKKAAKKEAKK